MVPPDSYFDLVRRFPLRPIRNDAEYERAGEIAGELAVRGEDDLDSGERDYLDALDRFISDYDVVHHQLDRSHQTPVSILKHLMEQSDMTVSDLGRIVGGQPTASLILGGRRQMSKTHIRRLAAHFKVDGGLFL
jgi:HTH-type transcriptional regulator/antitoxin HigA